MQVAQAEALLYKKLAAKYKALRKGTAKRNDDKILGRQANVDDVKKIKHADLIDIGKAENTLEFAEGVFGKCHLKMYQGHLVVAKEF
ncbi:Hypothetical predicted protein [Paramuricea clavata]|uniref:Uncharacterized protein n=1 Tax=Paramuricea clavata TaxID=317549 RepID=A0A6S7GHH8_PARCT|nr:Hypothetical predicted protein [Paramuricea clavata]